MPNRPLPATVVGASLAACALAMWVALGPLGGVPHLSDEVVYTLQAKLFAAGQRTGPPGDNPSMLLYPFWVTRPVSYGVFPPGWPGLLALGERVGLAWAVNPVLALAWPLVAWGVARELVSEPTARLAAWVAALSPGIGIMAGSRMSHTSVALALGAALIVVLRRRDGTRTWLLAAAAVAYTILARPFDGLVLGGPLLLAGLWRAPGQVARAGLVVLPGLAALLLAADNQALTGSWSTFPVNLWFDAWQPDPGRPPGCNALGFGSDIGCHATLGSFGHSPYKALALAGEALLRLDRLLFGLHGGLVLVAIGCWRLGRRGWPLWLAAALVVLGYSLYWSPGRAYGARFWHPLQVALPLWVALGLQVMPRPVRAAWALLLLVGTWFVWDSLADRFWCVDDSVAEEAEQRGIRDGVLLLAGRGTRATAWPGLGVDAFTCDPLLEAGDGFLLMDPTGEGLQVRHALPDLATDRRYIDQEWPGRPAWRLEHDVATDQRTWIEVP